MLTTTQAPLTERSHPLLSCDLLFLPACSSFLESINNLRFPCLGQPAQETSALPMNPRSASYLSLTEGAGECCPRMPGALRFEAPIHPDLVLGGCGWGAFTH